MKERYLDASNVDEVTASLVRDLEGARARGQVPDLAGAALVLLDLQRIFVDPGSPAFLPAWPAVEHRARELASAFRAARRPVVLTRHLHPPSDPGSTIGRFFGRLLEEGDEMSALAAGWEPGPADLVVVKSRHSAFAGSDLAGRLKALGVETVVLAGVQAHLCVLATAVEAGSHDIMPVVALDAIAAPSLALHRSSLQALSGGLAWIATRDEILARLGG